MWKPKRTFSNRTVTLCPHVMYVEIRKPNFDKWNPRSEIQKSKHASRKLKTKIWQQKTEKTENRNSNAEIRKLKFKTIENRELKTDNRNSQTNPCCKHRDNTKQTSCDCTYISKFENQNSTNKIRKAKSENWKPKLENQNLTTENRKQKKLKIEN